MTDIGGWMVLVSLAALGCGSCPTEGCDALRKSAKGEGTGIGGIVAEKSDVVGNGCQECRFGDAQLAVWAVDSPVMPDQVDSVISGPPDERVSACKRFRIELPEGAHLLCRDVDCVNLSVTDGALTTANVKLRKGPTSFFVIDDSGKFTEQFGL
jgi:hypothetical protein